MLVNFQEVQIEGEVHVSFGSRIPALSCKPRDSEGFCLHPTSKPGHLWRGQTQAWSLQSAQQLLTRAVDRGATLCPGEQRGTQFQMALGTVCLQNHNSGRNREEGRLGLAGGHRCAGGTSSSKDLDQGVYCLVNHRCL